LSACNSKQVASVPDILGLYTPLLLHTHINSPNRNVNTTSENMSIDTLIKAAEYLDRREREAEHGYASTLPPEDLRNTKRPKTKKSQGNRSTHNELEKNRRAHLRSCLEKLKEMVPLGPESSRHTTLGLLTKAKRFIKNLEDRDRKHAAYKEQLNREQRYLRRRLEQLSGCPVSQATTHPQNHRRTYQLSAGSNYQRSGTTNTATSNNYLPPSYLEYTDHHLTTSSLLKRRSVSECSSSTSVSSSASSHSSAPSPISETDEVDVIGYTSTQSDTDDHSSVQSASSDSGVTMSTSRLTLSETAESYM
jgi:MAX dimerization protein